MRVKIIDMIIWMLFLALFKIFIIPAIIHQLIKILFIVIILFFLISRVHWKELFNLSLLWGGIIIFTSILGFRNGHIGIDNAMYSVLHACCIYVTYTLFMYCSREGLIHYVRRDLMNILIFYCFLSLLTIIVNGTGVGTTVIYFAGNKFRTSYYFIMLLACVMNRIKYESMPSLYKKFIVLGLGSFIICICFYMQCVTGVICAAVVMLFYFLPGRILSILRSHWILLVALGVAASLIFVILFLTDFLTSNEAIKYLIEDIFGKDTKLTGRFTIYKSLLIVISRSLTFGYGYGNYAVGTVVGFGNAQNSVMQLLVDYGVLGLIGFILLILQCFKKAKPQLKYYFYYAYIYGMLVGSMVEICFDYNFYTMLFLIRWDNEEIENQSYIEQNE